MQSMLFNKLIHILPIFSNYGSFINSHISIVLIKLRIYINHNRFHHLTPLQFIKIHMHLMHYFPNLTVCQILISIVFSQDLNTLFTLLLAYYILLEKKSIAIG